MKRKLFVLFVTFVGAAMISGCVGTVDGRHRAGVPLAKDKVIARYERAPKDIWIAAQDVIKYNGVLTNVDQLQATLQGSVDTRTVWVRVDQDDPKYTRVTVQARTKGGLADVALASEIDKQIAIRLATGNLTPATRPPAPKS